MTPVVTHSGVAWDALPLFSEVPAQENVKMIQASMQRTIAFFFMMFSLTGHTGGGEPVPKGKQHGKIDTILRIHQEGHPRNYVVAMILGIITTYYLLFAMLFMQP